MGSVPDIWEEAVSTDTSKETTDLRKKHGVAFARPPTLTQGAGYLYPAPTVISIFIIDKKIDHSLCQSGSPIRQVRGPGGHKNWSNPFSIAPPNR